MLKHICFLSLGLLLAACSSTGGDSPVGPVEPSPRDNTDVPVSFSTYVSGEKQSRAGLMTRAEGDDPSTPYYGDITSIETLRKTGFGVFGYYTGTSAWSAAGASITPNFMYNQSVTWNNFDANGNATSDSKQNSAGQTPAWLYEPVKFWPNGESTAGSGIADDKVSFFAYAPWVASQTSGSSETSKTSGSRAGSVLSFSGNSTTGSPKITYTVGSDPEKSIDLLWGVKPSGTSASSGTGSTSGMPYLDQTKPSTTGNIDFLFKHALAKLNIIMYGNFGSTLGDNDSTMVLLKSVKITHRVPKKGILDLNNTEAGSPAWDKSTFVFDNTSDDASTADFDEENTSTINLAEYDIPDTLQDIDYGTDPDAWKARFNKGRGGIRNNININLHKGAFMLIPPDSADITALNAGERVLRVEVTYTVQTIDYRLPKHYWRHEETLTALYPVHRIKAGTAYIIRLGLSLSQVDVTVSTEQWREPVVFSNTVDNMDDNNFDIDPTPDDNTTDKTQESEGTDNKNSSTE